MNWGRVTIIFICLQCNFVFSNPNTSKEIQINMTEYYNLQSNMDSIDLKTDHQNFKNFRVLLVSGIFSKSTGKIIRDLRKWKLPMTKGSGVTFEDQILWLKQAKIPFTIAPIHSENSCDANARIIRNAIENTNENIILITHSKGGTDSLHAIVKYPYLRKRIKGWIAIQPPLMGSDIADYILNKDGLKYPLYGLIKFFKGNKESLRNLTVRFRSEFYNQYEKEIQKAISEIPVVSIAGEVNWRRYLFTHLFLNPFARLLLKKGKPWNDGMVPVKSSCLPGMHCLIFTNMDHFNPVFDLIGHFYGRHKRILLTRTSMYLLKRKMSNVLY